MSFAAAARDLCAFVDRSPTPWHAVLEIRARLDAAGFTALDEREAWRFEPGGKHYVVRGGSTIVAFVVGSDAPARAGFRMIGAHTDSPNLRVKPHADVHRSGYRQVGVEVYGGVIYSTWTDRDLSIAGRVTLARGAGQLASRLVDLKRPVARVANPAIHLNRGVNGEGHALNAQKHLPPLLGVGDKAELAAIVAQELGEDARDVLGLDVMLYDTQPSALGGLDEELVYAARLDNLGSCHAATQALVASSARPHPSTRLVVLYDHEECGSRSAVGAQGTMLRDVVGRIVDGFPQRDDQAVARAMSRSFLVSADMAHAVHPNYADLHEPQHQPELGKGLVIKSNANQSYATSGETAGRFALACREAGFSPQQYVVRSDLPCGGTIGSITAALLGVQTVDVGAPMLSMHSCRELCGARDVPLAIAAFERALESEA
jgi:aspartyl aminopeptidase